ncbi:MAG: PCRF domain-containing protein, partial [Acidobacteria bacterium]|nr:PCRF domain-containing protein [Acidobacteriota bacterium]
MRWCGAFFDVPANRARLKSLEQKTSDPAFWSDQAKAQQILRDRKQVEERLAADEKLVRISGDIETYFQMAHEEKNAVAREGLLAEVNGEIQKAEAYVAELETTTLLSGENDALNAIQTIKSGAGGTESQDWAEMLLRMYLRWAERKNFKTTILDISEGEGAGIKSATIRVEGPNAYGLLSTESGVHRLVRISPFDQAARR